MNNGTGAQIAAQWFDTPETISLNGFSFYGIIPQGGNVVDVTASVYLPDADGFPTGSPLATTTVTIDDNFSTLAEMREDAIFDTPVEINEPYLLVVENNSADAVLLGIGDLEENDGQGEGLSRMYLGDRWRNGLDVTVGGDPFDADFVLLPNYSVNLEVEFSSADACLDGAGDISFQATGSPILTNRFYNFSTEAAFQWDFGDGGDILPGEDITNTYGSSGPWAVELFGVMSAGDGTGCVVSTEANVGRVPQNLGISFVEDFGAQSVQFTGSAQFADTWTWDFGDGGSSMEQSPEHTYGSLGLFTACVNASNLCGDATVDGVCGQVLSPFADLAVTLGSESMVIDPESPVTYTVTVANNSGVQSGSQTLTHTIPGNLTGATWTCAASGASSCASAGAGSIADTVLIDPASSVVYTVQGVFEPEALESLVLIAQASIPTGDATDDNSAEATFFSSAAVILMDGFESGDTSAWSSVEPPIEP